MTRRTARDLRSDSRSAVLRAFFSLRTATRQELSQHTGLSVATVSTLVKEFLTAGVVHVEAVVSSGVGRPLEQLRLDPSRGYIVGVDVAETYVETTVFDLSLDPRGTVSVPLDEHQNSPQYVVDGIRLAVHGVLALAGVSTSSVVGVGVSLPGQVQPDLGVSVFAPNWAWHDVRIKELLTAELGMHVHVDNPLKAIAVAELWFGAGREHRDLAIVNLGTGVGSGLVINGELVRGVSNNAGEWGHTLLALDGRLCRCGRQGCVEAYVGVNGMKATLSEIQPDHPALLQQEQRRFVDAVYEGVVAGDPVFVELVDETARYLAASLGDLVNMINPEHVVLTGWTVARLGDWLIPLVRAKIPDAALRSSVAVLTVSASSLASSTVALGMSTLTLEHFLAAVGLPSRTGPAPAQQG
ncbi:transcriptional regulator/sugar kinase [Sanguibacter keddieii DSM 10542]|uniref:Transcriptional regulator/sugar kinase n=1 Tax=Sanguibacter keddieii (strain ATCC 51767 / DSM 10542 / NCFB 3025 / ST-74) TaxID=446469 RepID=D1BAX4_SANKS|nr:ROK family transcriptional regulator [Sanguibacter keddieii]ACZ22675.1 transcriptional regulator/sugar kinase [Sanguibacter keddieii DSM 10542]